MLLLYILTYILYFIYNLYINYYFILFFLNGTLHLVKLNRLKSNFGKLVQRTQNFHQTTNLMNLINSQIHVKPDFLSAGFP